MGGLTQPRIRSLWHEKEGLVAAEDGPVFRREAVIRARSTDREASVGPKGDPKTSMTAPAK